MGPTVRFEGISKRYGSVQALLDVSFECQAGEIRAVVGENGAGKSTLMGVLGGFVRPDSGSVFGRNGARLSGDAAARRHAGIAMVHQHFMLVPAFTVEENLALSELADAPAVIRVADLAEKAAALGRELGWPVDPRARVSDLTVGQQQRLEILKSLATGADVLILDEPTAVLREEEVEELFRVLRGLRDEGKTILLVAHKLAEVLAIADRIAVLRGGILTADVARTEADVEKLTHWMLGERPATPEATECTIGEVALRAVDVRVQGDRGEVRVDGASFEVRQGEVLGISGVEGNGQIELAEALAGVRPSVSGEIHAQDVGYIPQDRHRDGLALEMTIEENLLIVGHRNPKLRRGRFLLREQVYRWADGLRRQFEIAAAGVGLPVRTLSGGNQQKVVVGRTLDAHPGVLVAVNPTRGLDVRAAAFVRRRIREAAGQGAAVVLFSTDRDELEEVAGSRLFMSGGRLFESEAAALAGAKS